MSERHKMKGNVLSKIENYLKHDIEGRPDIINLSEKDKYISDKDNVGLKKAKKVKKERTHPIYRGKREDKISLSKALEKLKFDKWERDMNWYRKHPTIFLVKQL